MNHELMPQDQPYTPVIPEFMSNNPELVEAWQRGIDRAEVMMDPERAHERQLPLPANVLSKEPVSAEQAQDEAPFTLDSRYIDGKLFLCAVTPDGDILAKELANEVSNTYSWESLARKAQAALDKKSKR